MGDIHSKGKHAGVIEREREMEGDGRGDRE